MFEVISSGSSGNCIRYHKTILVDVGVPYSLIKPFVNELQLILFTHEHKDHINITTVKKLAFERPTLRFGCCEWMIPLLHGIKNVDVYRIGEVYNYGQFSVSPVKLYHDVDNCGYRIFKGETKIFHATDTSTLEGITAKNYDLYSIESNYNEDTVFDSIREKEYFGQYAYQRGSVNSHLSEQQTRDFIFKNRKESSEVLRLHETKTI